MFKTLPRTSNNIKSDFWVDEAIWGHRLYDEQTPWLCLMEFMGVLNSECERERAFMEQEYNTLAYSPYTRLYLRNILFNNPFMEIVYRDYQATNDEQKAWSDWIKLAEQNFGGSDYPNLSYLKENFDTFDKFYETVKFLQSNTIEGENNKRWSSQFIFPYGKECLYEDLRVNGNKVQNDRRFFGRTGELLYLMLSRSTKGEELLSFLEPNIINSKSIYNRIVQLLQPNYGKTEVARDSTGSYLPYEYLPEYTNMADDWINIFNNKIPAYDTIPHIVNITGLHMIIYFLNRSKDVLNQSNKTQFILEILAPKKTIIRDLASDCYINNNNLSRQALERYIRSIKETEEWKNLQSFPDPFFEAQKLLNRQFLWPSNNDDLLSENIDSLVEELVDKAIARHKQHVNNFHRVWGREIGFSSSRNSQRIRYAPTDSLLKSLVLANVPERMEFQDFLRNLYEKYGFIIGDKEATEVINSGQADQEAFSDNSLRLEQRLSSMGLLRRLSDACAYVENPFAKDGV
ncbi:hypothetical protein QNH44_14875 [Cytobacillus firmus]|uniref:hypothetical protein n=1 Tax=Cytobacillus firmus TaxID=1399 RepID=UPI0024C10E49|nr:hypothetical protein [Cytobacillus firmus]WHY32312.1 hypothetical protein QNH44_14875 [Cytobacillus firmus]